MNIREEFEKVIAPYEVMAGGCWTRKGVEEAVKWAFEKAAKIAESNLCEGDNDFGAWENQCGENIAKAIRYYQDGTIKKMELL